MRPVWLVTPLILLAILATAGSAYALDEAEVTSDPVAEIEEEVESEDECVEEDTGEETSEATEEECEAAAEGTSFSPAEGCYLRTATARMVAYPGRGTMRLTVGYTTYAPARATVEYGTKSDPRLGTVSRRLGRSGVVRLSKHLSGKAMEELQSSRSFTVTVHVPEAPRDCERFEVQRLRIERSSDSRVTWSENR